MRIADIICPQRVNLGAEASSKKRALEILSGMLVPEGGELPSRRIFDALFARERLGSTGMGHGVALPHGRMAELGTTLGAFVRVNPGVDFDAPDGEPVDLVFAMVVPEVCTEVHLQLLAQLAETFSSEQMRAALRAELTAEGACSLLGSATVHA